MIAWWRGLLVVAAAVGAVEAARRAGVGPPDLTPLYLLAVVYAALDGGVWPGLAGVFITFAHALATAGGGGPGLYTLAVTAPATVAVVTLLADRAIGAEPLPEPAQAPAAPEALTPAGDDTVTVEREAGTLAFTAVSPNAERLLGIGADLAFSSAEFWASGLHPGDRARVQAAYDALKRAPAECTLTYRVLSADAGFIRVRETLRPHRALPGGRVLKLCGAIERLPDTEAPVSADTPAGAAAAATTPRDVSDAAPGEKAMSRLAAALDQPLDVLTGWARALRSDPDAATRARAAEMIERAVSAQARVLQPLLRDAPPRPRLLDMALVVHAALEPTRPAAQARGITVAWSVDPVLELVHGDAARLEQIVRTMLGNAIGLAPDGARLHAAIEQAGSVARLRVYDTADEQAASFVATLPVTTPDGNARVL